MNKLISDWLYRRREQAVTRRPEDAKAWAQFYAVAAESHRCGEVFTFCQNILLTQPHHHQAWMFLQLAATAANLAGELEKYCRKMILDYPDHMRAWGYLDLIYESNEPAMLAFCREVAQHHPGSPPALTRLNRDYKKAGKYAEMITACLAIVGTGQADAQTWTNLGDAYAARVQLEEAIRAYKNALEKDPNYVVVLNNLGNVYQTMGRHVEAIECYKRSLKINPHDATPWVWLCLSYIQKGDIQAAQDTVKEVKKRLPVLVNMLTEEIAITSIGKVAQAETSKQPRS